MTQPATAESLLDDHPDSYWLVADVLNIEWRKGCLTAAGCAEPRFQVTKMNTANNEANLISWPITFKLAESGHFERSTKVQHSSAGKVVMHLKGKCFNASLAMQKYDRCPTCTEHHSIAVVEQYSDPEMSSDFLHRLSGNRQFLYVVIILSAFTVILTTGFACLLIAFLQQKHQLSVSTSKHSLNPERSNVARLLRACDDDDSRYDLPLEQAQLPATMHQRSVSHRNFNTKNEFTPISHSLTAPIADLLALARSDCRKTSPTSSFGTELHDSGLGSV
ncbi:unnamed protein product [Litomosoides sigmodontis]|uniref:C2 domain-containing protein n=1 Tax=Litomosoides sigmodontis TaxID=42156 RepID=A0A3P6TUE4_LITSI|nr:unnamed protein product [Litomosoides sigmodontis]